MLPRVRDIFVFLLFLFLTFHSLRAEHSSAQADPRKSVVTIHSIELSKVSAIDTELRIFFPKQGPAEPLLFQSTTPPVSQVRRPRTICAPHHHTPSPIQPQRQSILPPIESILFSVSISFNLIQVLISSHLGICSSHLPPQPSFSIYSTVFLQYLFHSRMIFSKQT